MGSQDLPVSITPIISKPPNDNPVAETDRPYPQSHSKLPTRDLKLDRKPFFRPGKPSMAHHHPGCPMSRL